METPDPNIVVRCRGITKAYGEADAKTQALRGVDLDVNGGELLMLVGPSGCGKTTLISIIATILDPDDGECQVFDHDPRRMPLDERTRFRGTTIGFVFQSFNLLPSLTAVENVAVPLLIQRTPPAQAKAQALAALDQVGLGAKAQALPGKLSGGQQQRVAIARALVHQPRLVVCDEPTSSLDHASGHTVMNLLRQVGRTPGRALIVVTHDSRIFEFADRIAQMDDGRITGITRGRLQ